MSSERDDNLLQQARREMDNLLNARMDAFEQRMGKIEDLMERMVRVEERLTTHLEGNEKSEVAMKNIESRLNTLENAQQNTKNFMGKIERFGWIIVVAVVSNWDNFRKWLAGH